MIIEGTEDLPTVMIEIGSEFFLPTKVRRKEKGAWELMFQVDRSINSYRLWMGDRSKWYYESVTQHPGDTVWVCVNAHLR